MSSPNNFSDSVEYELINLTKMIHQLLFGLINHFFIQKTIGTSTITSKPPTSRSDEGGDGDKLPISTYFNEVENDDSNRQERKMNVDSSKESSNFPVFDAVPN